MSRILVMLGVVVVLAALLGATWLVHRIVITRFVRQDTATGVCLAWLLAAVAVALAIAVAARLLGVSFVIAA